MSDDGNPKENAVQGVTRRGFITSVGAGAVAAAAGHTAQGQQEITRPSDEQRSITLMVNRRPYTVVVEPRTSLLWVLREQLGLTATKVGCERGECGVCSVLLDGAVRYACLTLAVEAEGAEITTVEGLMDGEELGDVQQAFVEEDAFQCGYCTSGQIIAAQALLSTNSAPSDEEIRRGMSGNLCRCGAYQHIHRAVTKVAGTRRSSGGES